MKNLFLLVIALLGLTGCQGMFGTIDGEHYRYVLPTVSALESTSPAQIGTMLSQQLPLHVTSSDSGHVFLASSPPDTTVSVLYDRSWPAVVLEVRYFGPQKEAEGIARDSAEKIRPLLKGLFPTAKEESFIRYGGLFGP